MSKKARPPAEAAQEAPPADLPIEAQEAEAPPADPPSEAQEAPPADTPADQTTRPKAALLLIGPEGKADDWARTAEILERISRKRDRHVYLIGDDLVPLAIEEAKKLELHVERAYLADCHLCGGVATKYGDQARGDLWFFKCENCQFSFSSAAPR